MLALVEELGVREGSAEAPERRQLMAQALGDDPASLQALEKA
jgi:hypothetical protein